MSHSSDRLSKVREDIKVIQAGGHLDPDTIAWANDILGLSDIPSVDIGCLERLVGRIQKSLAEKRDRGMQRLLFLMADWVSKMISVLRNEEKRLAALGNCGFDLLRGRKIEDTCSIIEEERAKIRKWEEDGSLPGQKPPTPALHQLDVLCKKFAVNSDLMIEMFKINRDRNAIAHDRPPELKLSGTESDITTFKNFTAGRKSEVRQLEKEGVIDEKTRELLCNILEECASYELKRVEVKKAAELDGEVEGEMDGEMEARESLPKRKRERRPNNNHT